MLEDTDTWRLGGRGREGCWRTQIIVGWKEREGGMLEDMEVDILRMGGEGGILEDMEVDILRMGGEGGLLEDMDTDKSRLEGERGRDAEGHEH